MKKKIIGVVLSGFVLVSLTYLVYAEISKRRALSANKNELNQVVVNNPSKSDSNKNIKADKTIAYYFHGTARCYSCTMMEKYIGETIKSKFNNKVDKGVLEWKSINVELPENNHFIRTYKLFTKTFILSKLKDGKEIEWKNFDKIWKLVSDEIQFKDYIKTEMESFLEG